MFGSNKLTSAIQRTREIDPLMGFQDDERVRRILSCNPAIAGNKAILDAVLSAGELKGFFYGAKIIIENAHDDDVFFILAGEVDIYTRKQKVAIRCSPNQIGEMAAMDPGMKRSASVIARSDTVTMWKISGNALNEIMINYPKFRTRLSYEISERFRERIAAGKIAAENNSFYWFAISIGVGIISWVISWVSLQFMDWTVEARIIASSVISILSFVFMVINNPVFFWRRCFYVSLLCLIGKSIFEKAFTIEIIGGFSNLSIAAQTGGNDVNSITVFSSFISSIPFIVALIVSAYKAKD